MTAATKHLTRMVDALARISDERTALTRTFLSPAMRRANAQVATWMRAAGLAIREDEFGNVIGRSEPAMKDRTKQSVRCPTLLLGSHLDTVRNAGRFDGALGVLAPIAAMAELARRGISLSYAIEVIGFSEEEGVRFSSAYLGSKGFVGALSRPTLQLRDSAGTSVAQALAELRESQSRPKSKSTRAKAIETGPSRRNWSDVLGYCELHIEQGPILERKKLAVGVVSAIAGQTRGRVVFHGQAGHAGTTPMRLRRDALAAAAEFILATERLARADPSLVATVGTVAISSAAPNVIPGTVTLSLDVRHVADARRNRAVRMLERTARRLGATRNVGVTWDMIQDNAAVTCSPRLTGLLAESVKSIQGRSLSLVSGAGHDGVVLSSLMPITMLFVRCRDGLSHHPDEHATTRDLGMALEVLIDFLLRMDRQVRR